MISHRETLRRLLAELEPLLCSASVKALRQRGGYELFLWIEPIGAPETIVEVHLRAGLTTLFRRPPSWREPERTAPWAEELWGSRILRVALHPVERQVRLVMESGEECILFLYGTAHSGALVRDRCGQCRSCLGAPREVLEHLLQAPPRQLCSWEDHAPQTPLVRALAQDRHQLGTIYARELCHRCGIEPEVPLEGLSAEQRNCLRSALVELHRELASSSTVFLLRRPEGPPLVSLIELKEYPERLAVFDCVSDAVAERVRRTLLWEEFTRTQRQLRQRLEQLKRQLTHQRLRMEERLQHEPDVERYRLWGNLLLAHPQRRERGRSEITVSDWAGALHHIALDPAKTLQENADAYFRQARRLEEALRVARQRIPVLHDQERVLGELLEQLQHAQTERELTRIARRLQELFPPRELSIRTGERIRIFPLGDGFVLYIGKDARSNEALTFRFARPHDLFLHVRGFPGAHGILRGPRKGELPPMQLLEQAAALVAYYSRGRSSAIVPVVYTWKKYVRRVKGSVGAVRLEREELLWVRPAAPVGWESP